MKTFIALLLFSNSVLAASLYAPNGTYLGEVGGNPYGKNNIDNPASYYNNSGMSINSPNGMYGNEYSQQSPNNPMVIHSTPTFTEAAPASRPYSYENSVLTPPGPMTLPPCTTCGANYQELPPY